MTKTTLKRAFHIDERLDDYRTLRCLFSGTRRVSVGDDYHQVNIPYEFYPTLYDLCEKRIAELEEEFEAL